MKLVLYGGGDASDNYKIDRYLFKKILKRENVQVTYIPSCNYLSYDDYNDFVQQYKKFKVKKFIYFPIDSTFTNVLKSIVFKSDIIHLGGGNTYYFLKCLRRAKLFNDLKCFVRSGGLLTGLSAGAILMTPNISTAGFPPFDRDDNEENIKNFNSLNLVPFEFFPHYKNSKRYDTYLTKHSLKMKNRPLYAAPDGSGIIVNEREITFINKNYIFINGEKALIN